MKHEHVLSDELPQAGDVVVCIECAAILKYNCDLTLSEVPDVRAYLKDHPDVLEGILCVQERVLRERPPGPNSQNLPSLIL